VAMPALKDEDVRCLAIFFYLVELLNNRFLLFLNLTLNVAAIIICMNIALSFFLVARLRSILPIILLRFGFLKLK
jgi:hypothetical protein